MISLLKYLKAGTSDQVSVANEADVYFGDKASSQTIIFSGGSKKARNFIIR